MASCVVCQVPATLWCSNDKAHLCSECDVKIHSTNAVASKHSRFTLCGHCQAQPSAHWCKNDCIALCDTCDADIHLNNPLSAMHEITPVEALPPCEVTSAARPAVAPVAPCESVAQTDDASDAAMADSFLVKELGPSKVLSPSGSEAVVPVMSNPFDEDFAASLAVPAFKDIKDFDDFKVLDGDTSWMDIGFDFSDILGDTPIDDAGLVPTFNCAAEEQPALVPSVPTPSAAPAPAPAPLARETGRKRSAPTASATSASAPERPAKVPSAPAVPQHPMHAFFYASTPAYAAAGTAYPSAVAVAALAASGANLTREQRVARWLEKRKHRKFEKTIRYASRKAYAEIRPRIKGRFARKEEIEAWKSIHGGEDAVVPEYLD